MERIVLILYSNYFGHQARHWNPKMARYIYGKRNGIHIIDLIQTYFQLKKVLKFLTDSASQGKTFLFVGTKKQAAPVISKIAIECNSFYVNQRWLGGMLTNWQTVKSSIKKLNELELREKTSSFQNLPKKEIALAKKQKERLEKYIGGLKEMKSLPDVVILIGQPAEKNAVHECTKLGIRSITILDTDCDPTCADLFIPANDDSVAAIEFLLMHVLYAIKRGQKIIEQKKFLKKSKISKVSKKKAFQIKKFVQLKFFIELSLVETFNHCRRQKKPSKMSNKLCLKLFDLHYQIQQLAQIFNNIFCFTAI
eukprot:TRINITY_DN238_c0_g1_i4.p1 TRINITY_DN238_c0_g1~~TRINITY_DN238_c0_g1_i4.p1  ORF type:complete len:309 (-),score=18.47 TRINITY_DN238_c0_g1_i4:233-1159(-)